MRTSRKTALAAIAVSAVALLPTGASAEAKDAPVHAAGDPVVTPVLPSAVRVRIKRGENALDRAADYVDRDQPDKAVASLKHARRNMYAAWRSAKYVVENAPVVAPPVEDKAEVRAAQDDAAPVGTQYATPEETALGVIAYQHDVVAASFGLLDGAKGALRDQVSTTLFAALDRRDASVAYIKAIPVVAPPVEDKRKGDITARDEVLPPTWADLMPGVVVDLDDEIQQSKELALGGALTTGEKRINSLARIQISDTKDTINTAWPPVVVPED